MYTQKIANTFHHIQDHSRLGLENKFLENKSGRIFFGSTGLFTNSCQQIWGCVNQPFIIFINHIWGETVLFIIQTSDRMRYFTNFQDKLHSVNIWTINRGLKAKPFKTIPKSPIRPAGSHFYSASYQCSRVFEWTLIELRFNIITNLLLLFFIF